MESQIVDFDATGLNGLSGLMYLDQFVERMTESFFMAYGGIFEIDHEGGEDHLKPVLNYAKSDNKWINLNDKPDSLIDHVINTGFLVCEKTVQNRFPNEPFLEELNAESFIGVVLRDVESDPIGLLLLVGQAAVSNIAYCKQVIYEHISRINAEFDRVISRRKIKKFETNLRYFVEISRDLIWEIDSRGFYTYVNRASNSIYGYRQEEMLGHHFSEFMSLAAAEEFNGHLQQSISGNGEYDVITEHLTKDGRPLRVVYNTKPKYNNKKELVGFSGSTTDITESVQAEIAVRNNSEIFSSILSRLPVIYYRMDEKGYLLDIRGKGLERMGVNDMDWVGKPVHGLFIGMDDEINTALEGQTVHFKCKGTFEGQPWWFLTSMFFDNWTGYGAIGFSVDITEQIKSEEKLVHLLSDNRELAQRLVEIQEEERRNLARELHDELGQSITAVKSLARAITTNVGDSYSEVRSLGNSIIDLSGRLYEVVNGIMRRLRPDILDSLGFKETIKSCVVNSQLEKMGINCQLNFYGDIDTLDEIVQISIYRIIQECLTNISKYAMASNVRIDIGREYVDKIVTDKFSAIDAFDNYDHKNGYDILSICVCDDGVGMDLAKDLIRTDKNSKVGLIGIKERITALGGDLRIESHEGEGVSVRAEIDLNARKHLNGN